ncbi:MAG: PQQ-binding-like beta-propeller repeat protein [Methanotrichaceae archaeon]
MEKNKTKFVGGIAIALLLFGLAFPSVVCSDVQDWPQFHLNAQHTGSVDYAAPDTALLAWESEAIGAQEGSSVSVAQGRVFVNCVTNLTCLDQRTGKVLWKKAFDDTPDLCQVFGFTPSSHQGRVFLSGAKTLCLNASDGKEIWNFTAPTGKSAVDGGPAISDGKVIVSDWDGHNYYCLEEDTGKLLWNFTVKGDAQSTPAIDQGKVVFGGWDWGLSGKVYCVNLDNGKEIWNRTTRDSPCGSAAILGDVAYFTTYNFDGDGQVMAVSLKDGSLLWEKTIQRTDCTPALANGLLYVCGGCDGFSDKITYCFNASSGDLLWNTSREDGIGEWRCSPAYADGLVFVGKTDAVSHNYNALYALNATTGNVAWSYSGGGSAPAIAGGMIFSIGGGKVYAFGDGGTST